MSNAYPASSANPGQLPKWQRDGYTRRKGNLNYTDYILTQFRHRFTQINNQFQKLEHHLGDVLPADELDSIKQLIDATRQGLERNDPPLLDIVTQLLQLEKGMLELLPDPYLESVAQAYKTKLELDKDPHAIQLQEVMATQVDPATRPAALRTTLRQLINARSMDFIRVHVESVNKLKRFSAMRSLLVVLVIFLLAVAPFLFKTIDPFWQDSLMLKILQPLLPNVFGGQEPYFTALLISGIIMFMGALGGYLGGLFSNLKKEETVFDNSLDRLLTAVRPALGAIFAILLYLFLDWKVIPGVVIDNAGTVFLISFLVGFSARFAMSVFSKVSPGGARNLAGMQAASSTDHTAYEMAGSSDTELFSASYAPPVAPTENAPVDYSNDYPPVPPTEPFDSAPAQKEPWPTNPSL